MSAPRPEDRPVWLLGPDELDAIRADERLIAALAAGEAPDPSDPLGELLVAWLAEVTR